MLHCGTHDGLYAVEDETVERLLDCGRVWSIAAEDGFVVVAAEDGLFWREDDADWETAAIDGDPTAVIAAEGDLLVGTDPVGVYRGSVRQADGGWTPVGDLEAHPHSQRWNDRAQGDQSSVRTLALHPDAGILAGLEPGGVYAFDGDFWRQYGDGVHDDVHDLLVLADGDVVAATGNGLYRTEDGDRWIRLDVDFRDFWADYFREAVAVGGRLHTSANHWGPEAPGGTLFEGPVGGDNQTDTFGFNAQPVPTDDPAFVTSWAVDGNDLYAGTMSVGDGFEQQTAAPLLVLREDAWQAIATLPAGITAMGSTSSERGPQVNIE